MDKISLDTGDLILFRGKNCISCLIECCSNSKYSHVGIILKNPKFINNNMKDGLYILESMAHSNQPDEEDHVIKSGVQIHNINDKIDNIKENIVFVRKLNINRDETFYKKFEEIHKEIYNKPYDMSIFDWVCAKYNINHKLSINTSYKTKKKFWCSALVSYVYCELGIIDNNINWSIISPKEFSSFEGGNSIKFLCNITNDELLYI
jgi:hypothetical protein